MPEPRPAVPDGAAIVESAADTTGAGAATATGTADAAVESTTGTADAAVESAAGTTGAVAATAAGTADAAVGSAAGTADAAVGSATGAADAVVDRTTGTAPGPARRAETTAEAASSRPKDVAKRTIGMARRTDGAQAVDGSRLPDAPTADRSQPAGAVVNARADRPANRAADAQRRDSERQVDGETAPAPTSTASPILDRFEPSPATAAESRDWDATPFRGPAPAPTTGATTSSSAAMGGSDFFTPFGLAALASLLAVPALSRRLRLAPSDWRPAPFVLLLERPG